MRTLVLVMSAVLVNGALAASGQILVPQSMYGVNAHVPSDSMLAKCQTGNIAWARIDLNWDSLEPARGVYDWAPIDAVVSSANSRGIHLYACMGHTPSWANGGQNGTVPPTDPNDWKDFVRTAVNRYKGSIRHWGLWNEPDQNGSFTGTSSKYVKTILIPGAQAIREADPTALRCAPDLAGDSYFLRDVINAGKDYIDVVTLHTYSQQVSDVMNKFDGHRSTSEDPNYKTILRNTGARGKAIWFTETGWATAERSHAVTEQEQARRYVDLLNEVRQRTWINKIFFYELKDDPHSGVSKWGVLNANLTEKLAYGAYRDYITAHSPVSGVTLTDLRRYSLSNFSVGSLYFSDRSFTVTSMPTYLQGCQGIQTRNGDAGATAANWIDFDVDREAEVYVAYDPRATSLPGWMKDYVEMSDVIGVSDPGQGYAKLYRKVVAMGEVVLGGNIASGASGAGNNYFVLVIPSGSGTPQRAGNASLADGTTPSHRRAP